MAPKVAGSSPVIHPKCFSVTTRSAGCDVPKEQVCVPSGSGYNVRAFGPLAQLVEQGTLNPKVIGSIPIRPTINTTKALDSGRGPFVL